MEDPLDYINRKLNDMTMLKKISVIGIMLLIAFCFYYIFSLDVIQVFTYYEHNIPVCNETYVNGQLQTEPCPQNTNYFPKERIWQTEYKINFSNLTLNLNQS